MGTISWYLRTAVALAKCSIPGQSREGSVPSERPLGQPGRSSEGQGAEPCRRVAWQSAAFSGRV